MRNANICSSRPGMIFSVSFASPNRRFWAVPRNFSFYCSAIFYVFQTLLLEFSAHLVTCSHRTVSCWSRISHAFSKCDIRYEYHSNVSWASNFKYSSWISFGHAMHHDSISSHVHRVCLAYSHATFCWNYKISIFVRRNVRRSLWPNSAAFQPCRNVRRWLSPDSAAFRRTNIRYEYEISSRIFFWTNSLPRSGQLFANSHLKIKTKRKENFCGKTRIALRLVFSQCCLATFLLFRLPYSRNS